jgi:hypothetical protein
MEPNMFQKGGGQNGMMARDKKSSKVPEGMQ